MLCPICHKLEGEWQCQICRRIVCINDARPTRSGVYCVEHAPASVKADQQSIPRQENESSKAMKTAFITLFFLTIGLGGIIYAGQYFIDQFALQAGNSGIAQIKPAIESLQSVGMLILYFMIFLTAILGLGWFVTSRQGQK